MNSSCSLELAPQKHKQAKHRNMCVCVCVCVFVCVRKSLVKSTKMAKHGLGSHV